jgi:hypothetical protein
MNHEFVLASDTSGGPYKATLRNIAAHFSGGAYLPQLYEDTTAVAALTPWLIENITITFHNVQSDIYYNSIIRFLLSAAPGSMITNVNILFSECTLPYQLSGDGIALFATDIASVSVIVRDCRLPWEQTHSFVHIFGANTVQFVSVELTNLATDSSTTPSHPALRTHYVGELVTIKSGNNLTNSIVTMTNVDLSALEGMGGVLLLAAQHVSSVTMTVRDVVLPKFPAFRSVALEASVLLSNSTGACRRQHQWRGGAVYRSFLPSSTTSRLT